jgi:NAD(P)-dependent dehydrogenase (short-subunit alcohol dehydrogenase family)
MILSVTPQSPIGSGFDHRSTAAEVISGIDLTGKTALVTGGYSGIGTEAVKALVSAGAHVIVAGRRPGEADITLAAIRDHVSVVALDLSDPASIDSCADAVTEVVSAKTGKLDLLINNAGIMACPLTRDARGYESQFATNHLGHFQLAMRLWPLIKAAGADGGARVVALSSLAHKRGKFHAGDPNFEYREYDKWRAYGQAKTCNALFALHLDQLGTAHGVRAFSVHPGAIATNLGRYLTGEDAEMLKKRSQGDKSAGPGYEWKNVEAGAATTVWAATSAALNNMGGVYCEDCDIAQLLSEEEAMDPNGVVSHACDSVAAQALWEASEAMTGVRWPG